MLRSHRRFPVFSPLTKQCYLIITSRSALFTGNKISLKRNLCAAKTNPVKRDTVNNEEVEKFHNAASEWWRHGGSFRLLNAFNALRVPFIRDGVLSNVEKKGVKSAKPLQGFRVLDVGCGGGVLSEPLARLGAAVTGLDPSSENIRIATEHAAMDSSLNGQLSYVCDTVEDLVGKVDPFDALVCSEVIEHVDNPEFFVQCCVDLIKEGGSLFFTTFNKTFTSYLGGIILAENVFGIIPKGTHDWNKFIPPVELRKMLESQGCQVQVIHGVLYNIITGRLSWSNSNSLTYAMHAFKLKQYV